ncbi:N-acetyl-D-Glu racemase DgcA [Thalassotalea atypica]|uniref:N-acetyl-D-Glu racemase DgcA n=1 Tax=Thalassotalea atypica TaxID=2054316 RepID=UPI002572E72E|nr:N-acetyl-D-Glu racemase DgcA [Thalassotalea atypica]
MSQKRADDNASLRINVYQQQLPLKAVFRIARGAKTSADVIVVTISDGKNTGWAESVPYARYQESLASVRKQVESIETDEVSTNAFAAIIAQMPAGAARNALDCAFWDLQAKQQGKEVSQLLSLDEVTPCTTAQTLSIDTPEAMAKAVIALNNPPLVKVKLDNQDIIEKMTAIQAAAPDAKFIVDANEGWSIEDLTQCGEQLAKLNVILIEQPLPAGQDQALSDYSSPVPLCADESCHTRAELDYLKDKYEVVNIKLDKTGGLSEALLLAKEAKEMGFEIMLGCMVGSSLAMAPASLLSDFAQYVDLDGPLLISDDREHGFRFEGGTMMPLNTALWGGVTQPRELVKLAISN